MDRDEVNRQAMAHLAARKAEIGRRRRQTRWIGIGLGLLLVVQVVALVLIEMGVW